MSMQLESPQVFTLRNRGVARSVFRTIGDLFGDAEAPEQLVDVVIKEHKRDRSLAQNRLSFLWYKERAVHQGTTPEYEHRFCKLRYGCPILQADDADFTRLFMQVVEPLDYEDRIKAMKYLPVTRLLSVKQMGEYLTALERDSAQAGIVLTHPADIYDEAMGERR